MRAFFYGVPAANRQPAKATAGILLFINWEVEAADLTNSALLTFIAAIFHLLSHCMAFLSLKQTFTLTALIFTPAIDSNTLVTASWTAAATDTTL